MATVINMPKLSDTMTEGTLLSWKVKEGDTVEMGQIIAEVETDKATMEMEAFDDGVIHKLYAKEGDKVGVGDKMAVLLAEGEDESSIESDDDGKKGKDKKTSDKGDKDDKDSTKEKEDEDSKKDKKDKKQDPKKDEGRKPAAAKSKSPGGRIKASPLARKIADEKGLDLEDIEGTGPGGRIVKADVESARPGKGGRDDSRSSAAPGPAAIRPVVGDEDELIELSNMRKIIAGRLLASKLQLPHFYLRMEVDAGPLMTLRKQINDSEAKRDGGNKYTVNDFILKAVISAIQAVPAVNASWNGDNIVQFKKIGLAVAIAVEDGLVTPVLKDAGNQSLVEISNNVKGMAVRARDKKLKPDEFDGGTFTVSNLGAWGVDNFDAIINPPQAAILSVGAIKQVPVVENGEIKIGTRMCLGLSADHRVVDGAIAAEFLAEVRSRIEQPALMLV